jgi:hypothetical protein
MFPQGGPGVGLLLLGWRQPGIARLSNTDPRGNRLLNSGSKSVVA